MKYSWRYHWHAKFRRNRNRLIRSYKLKNNFKKIVAIEGMKKFLPW